MTNTSTPAPETFLETLKQVQFSLATRNGEKRLSGYVFEILGHQLVIHRENRRINWSCTDYTSGLSIQNALRGPRQTRRDIIASVIVLAQDGKRFTEMRRASYAQPVLNTPQKMEPG